MIHVNNSMDEARAKEILKQAEIQERYLSQTSPAAKQREEVAFIAHLQQHNLDEGGTSTILDTEGIYFLHQAFFYTFSVLAPLGNPGKLSFLDF